MDLQDKVSEIVKQEFSLELLNKMIIPILILIAGIILGKIVIKTAKKIIEKPEANKVINRTFFEILAIFVGWSIYIASFSLGIKYLDMPIITNVLSDILLVIPAFIGAIVVLITGSIVAGYLKKIISKSGLEDNQTISESVSTLVVLLTLIYSLKIAFLPLNSVLMNWIVLSAAVIFLLERTYQRCRLDKKEVSNS